MPEAKVEPKPIQLRWDDGKVVVTPEDEDRFIQEAGWAVRACQQKLAQDRFVEQFKNEFLLALHGWCESHSDRVRDCYVVPGSAWISVFIVTSAPGYDFDLSDAVADLEMALFEKKWPADVLQIPNAGPESLQTFFDREKAIQVYGNSR
jgi:hypothetical protein